MINMATTSQALTISSIQSYFSNNGSNGVDRTWGVHLNGSITAGRGTNYYDDGTSAIENFTSKVEIAIPSNIDIASSNYIILKVPVRGTCFPFGVDAVLSSKYYSCPNDTQNSSYNGLSADLNNNALAISEPYTDEACTSKYTSDNWTSATATVYYKLYCTSLAAGGTYYIYLLRNDTHERTVLYGATAGVGGYTATLNYNYNILYTVKYNANGGKFSDNTTEKTGTKVEGSNYTIPTYSLSKDSTSFAITGIPNNGSSNIVQNAAQNFQFSCWNTKADGSGTNYYSGGVITGNSDITLYAIYSYSYSNNTLSDASWWNLSKAQETVATYTVTFDANEGTCDMSSLNAEKIKSYSFGGWYSGENGTGEEYYNTTSFNSAKTIYANWEGSNNTEGIALPTAERLGYDFVEWNTKSDGTGTGYKEGSSYTPTGSITLYAIYEPKGLANIGSEKGLVKIFDGTSWRQAIPFTYNGSKWGMGI